MRGEGGRKGCFFREGQWIVTFSLFITGPWRTEGAKPGGLTKESAFSSLAFCADSSNSPTWEASREIKGLVSCQKRLKIWKLSLAPTPRGWFFFFFFAVINYVCQHQSINKRSCFFSKTIERCPKCRYHAWLIFFSCNKLCLSTSIHK